MGGRIVKAANSERTLIHLVLSERTLFTFSRGVALGKNSDFWGKTVIMN
jgi:hypothetical protein